jgi:hypothetical protein
MRRRKRLPVWNFLQIQPTRGRAMELPRREAKLIGSRGGDDLNRLKTFAAPFACSRPEKPGRPIGTNAKMLVIHSA